MLKDEGTTCGGHHMHLEGRYPRRGGAILEEGGHIWAHVLVKDKYRGGYAPLLALG